MVELRVEAVTETARASVSAYVGWVDLKKTVADLQSFERAVHGGLYDMEWGAFGPEYGNGAVHARFHFVDGRLNITFRAQSEYAPFGAKEVADEALLHLRSEAALLDRFIVQLQLVADGEADEAVLELI
jgi:hypothetical protein